MNGSLAIALAGLAITMIVGFTKTIHALSELEFKVNLMWEEFRRSGGAGRPGGLRYGDPPATDHRVAGDGL